VAPLRPLQHRKPKPQRKEDQIRIRLTSEQKTKFSQAAAKAGLELSAWLRFVAMREAERGGN